MGFRDRAPDFARAGAEILGISYDRPSANRAFQERSNLPFRLLSDPTRRVSGLYGARRRGLLRLLPLPRRITYLIDPVGCVARSYEVRDVSGHALEVLRDVEALGAADPRWPAAGRGAVGSGD